MSRRRKRPVQRLAGIAALAVAAIVAIVLLAAVIRLAAGALVLSRSGGSGSPDPQFAEPAETVTRPPDMIGNDGVAPPDEDPSAGWEEAELTPVDKTAEELGREEESED